MSGLNKVMLIGNLGADPEMRYKDGGSAIANLRVATSEQWKDKNTGEKQERTEWHRVVMFGRQAEVCGKYLTKGSQAYFEGKIQTRKWTDSDGADRYTTEIVAFSMQMLGGRSGGDRQEPSRHEQQKANGFQEPPKGEAFEDDIPF